MTRTKPKPKPQPKGKKPNAKRRAKPAEGSKAASLDVDETVVLADGSMAASLASEGTSAKATKTLVVADGSTITVPKGARLDYMLSRRISADTGKKVTIAECVTYPNAAQAATRRKAKLAPLNQGFVVEMSVAELELVDIDSLTMTQLEAACFANRISKKGGKLGMMENLKKFLNFQEYPTGGDKSDVKVALHTAGGGGAVQEHENECDANGGSKLFKLHRIMGEDGTPLVKMRDPLIFLPSTEDGDSTLALVGKGLGLNANGRPWATRVIQAIQEMNYIKTEKIHWDGRAFGDFDRRSIAFTHPLSSSKNLAGKYNMKLPPVGKKYLESMEGKLHVTGYLQVVENPPTEFVPKHERTSGDKKIPTATRSVKTVSPTRVSDPKVVEARNRALSAGIKTYLSGTGEATSLTVSSDDESEKKPAAKRQKPATKKPAAKRQKPATLPPSLPLLPPVASTMVGGASTGGGADSIVSGSFVVLVPGVGEALSEDTLKGMTFVISGCFPEAGGGEGKAVGVEQVTTMINSFGGRVASYFSKNTNFLLVGQDAVASKFQDAAKRKVGVISLRRLQGLLLGHLTLARLATLRTLKAEAFTGTAYQAAGSPPPGAANAPAKPAEPEKKPATKAPAIEVPPAVQPSAAAMPEEDAKMPAAEEVHAHEAQYNALAHQTVPSVAAPPAVLGELHETGSNVSQFWVEGKSAPPVELWQGV